MTRIVTRPVASADAAALARHGLHPVLARLYASRGSRRPTSRPRSRASSRPPTSKAAPTPPRCSPTRSPSGDACWSSPTTTATARPPARSRCAACACSARRSTTSCRTASNTATGSRRRSSSWRRRKPDLLITVDNGIASVDGVEAANARGIDVLVTDHHLPGDALPAARAIVNPNQPGCAFPSKHIAGVGVMFYVLLALRAELRRRGAFASKDAEPRLDGLLDLVALGTVADVVRLDGNNRILVAQGLHRSATAACSRASPRCSAPRAATRAPRRASISASASARA
jgi:single-stranded-DNA-specific exonuclease